MNKVIEYVIKAHTGQSRNQLKIPFYVHPLSVYKTLITIGVMDQNILNAALLHDVIEDTTIEYDEIQEKFDKITANLVQEVTSDERCYKVDGKVDRNLKAKYLIKKMNNMSNDALLIKLADRLDNIIDLANTGSKKWAKETYKETKEILEHLNVRKNEHIKTLMIKLYNLLSYYENIEK